MGLGRNMRKLLSVIVFACALFLFGAAEVTPVSAAFVCEHEIVTVPGRAPTCTQAGMTQQSYCNLCDEVFSYGEPIAALGHNIVKETVLPTCTEEGYDWEHCTRCGEIDKRTNATEALGHTEEVIASVAATCTQAGFTAGKRCAVCGEITEAPREVAALGHDYGDWVIASPTCEIAGERRRTCARCGTEERETLPATGHSWGDWEVQPPPSCTQSGERSCICALCGKKRTEEIPPTEHKSFVGEGKEPTCNADGYTAAVYCSVCGETLEESRLIPALGHDWGEWTERRAPTCVQKGLLVRACLRESCGYSEERETACVPHSTELLPALPAGCESAGLTEGSHCAVCGQIFIAQEEIAPIGHAWGDWRVTETPDYKETGERARSCSVCGKTQTEEIERLGGYGEEFLHAVEAWKAAPQSEKTEYMKKALALYERVERKDLVADEYEFLREYAGELPEGENYTALIVGLSCGVAVLGGAGAAAAAIVIVRRRRKK